MVHVLGPIVSFFVNNFGFRAVTICGAIIACVGYFVSSFSPNLDVLIVTYGALGGKSVCLFACRTVCGATQSNYMASQENKFTMNFDLFLNMLQQGKNILFTGFGFGLMYLPAMIICGFYFEKRRAFATGVAVCGSGIGMFILHLCVKCS